MTEPTGAAADRARARMRGTLLTLAGVLLLSVDALLIRLILADTLAVTFWRGLLMAVGFWLFHAVQSRSPGLRDLLRPSRPAILAAVLFAGSTLCFVAAVKHAPVADVLLILSVIPLTAALLSWIALGERLRAATWLAMLGAMAGLALVVGGGAAPAAFFDGARLGHGFALAVTLFIGGYFTVLRSGRVGSPLPALCLAGLLSAAIAAVLAGGGLALPQESIPWMLLLGLVILPISFALISLGPRDLPAAEVGLIMLLEAVFGAAWAWLVLGEVPTAGAFLGGGAIILSVGLRALAMRRE